MKKPVLCDRHFSYYFRSFASSSKFNFFAESTSSVCRNARLQAAKNASISNSILITNAIPAEGIPNCANKMDLQLFLQQIKEYRFCRI